MGANATQYVAEGLADLMRDSDLSRETEPSDREVIKRSLTAGSYEAAGLDMQLSTNTGTEPHALWSLTAPIDPSPHQSSGVQLFQPQVRAQRVGVLSVFGSHVTVVVEFVI